MSNVQQSHILSDIQQHQHRFSSPNVINQQSQFGRNSFNGRQNFQQQPSVSVAFPPLTSVVQNARFQQQPPTNQPPPNFRPQLGNARQVNFFQQFLIRSKFIPKLFFLSQPQSAPQQAQLKQTQFQRSVLNQVGQPAFNQQQQTQYNPFAQQQQQQLPIQQFGGFQDSFGQFRPNAAPLTQQAPIQSQQQFNQVRFPSQQQSAFLPQPAFQQSPQPSRLIQSPATNQNGPSFESFNNFQQQQPQQQLQQQPQQLPFLLPTQALPNEQRSNIFLDTRSEEQRLRELKDRQKLSLLWS